MKARDKTAADESNPESGDLPLSHGVSLRRDAPSAAGIIHLRGNTLCDLSGESNGRSTMKQNVSECGLGEIIQTYT
jgi:hypothetical protein